MESLYQISKLRHERNSEGTRGSSVPLRCSPASVFGRNPTASVLNHIDVHLRNLSWGCSCLMAPDEPLQLTLVKEIAGFLIQPHRMDALYCFFLSLPPCVRTGQFCVTTSLPRSGSRFSCSLSSINPSCAVPVTAVAGPRTDRRRRTCQKFERLVASGDRRFIASRQQRN